MPTKAILREAVLHAAKGEDFKLTADAAELIAIAADGSFRDALSILQKVLAVSKDKKVDVAEVEKVTGAPKSELVRQILKGIAEKDATSALKAVGAAVKDNIDARILTKLLIHRMRVVLLLRFAPDLAESFSKELTEADLELAKELAKNPNVTSDTLRQLLEAHSIMFYAVVPHLPLEMAIVDIVGKHLETDKK